MVERAIELGFESFVLTEHMPRNSRKDMYADEAHLQVEDLATIFDAYYTHAISLKERMRGRIELHVGMETDFIRPREYAVLIEQLRQRYDFEMIVGSIHHVEEFPIDYDQGLWLKAMEAAGGSVPAVFARYYDLQWDMLNTLKPTVVGHFDLIRLMAPDADVEYTDDVWKRVERNLRFIAEYGGLMECNSAALRKGWTQPYPRRDVLQAAIRMGVRICLSDDSHGVAQVGYGYSRALAYLKEMGVEHLYYLARDASISCEGIDYVISRVG